MKKVLIISFLIFLMIISLLNISYATIPAITEETFENVFLTEPTADYIVNLKVGQKCIIKTNTSIFHSWTEGDYENFDKECFDNYAEITPTATGTCRMLFDVGIEQRIFYFSAEENSENQKLDSKIIEINEEIPIKLDLEDITKDNSDYYVELTVGKTYELPFKNYSGFDFYEIDVDGNIISSNMNYIEELDLVKLDTTNNSNVKITGLKPGIVKGYLFQEIDELKDKTYHIYMSVANNTDNTTNNNNNSNTNTNNNNNSNPKPAGPSIKEVTIVPPTKTRYDVGEKLDLTGLKITAIYDNDKIEEVTKGYTVTGYNKNKNGQQTITISYKGFSRSYNVQVGEKIYDIDTEGKLPQTGDFFDLVDGLYLLITILSVVLICLVYKSTKHTK